MVIIVSPDFLAWYIRKGEEDATKPWWPDFLQTFQTAPEVIIETIYVNLTDAAAKATVELHKVVEVEFTYEFAKSVFVGLKEHFCKEAV